MRSPLHGATRRGRVTNGVPLTPLSAVQGLGISLGEISQAIFGRCPTRDEPCNFNKRPSLGVVIVDNFERMLYRQAHPYFKRLLVVWFLVTCLAMDSLTKRLFHGQFCLRMVEGFGRLKHYARSKLVWSVICATIRMISRLLNGHVSG